MAERPKKKQSPAARRDDGRTNTGVRFDPDVYERLVAAAKERGHSVNFMVNLAVIELLPRLIPADEVKLTK